jgi:hypothetical protein
MSEERSESLGFYEMLWDCEFCETKGLLAKSQRHCPECGAKQNADKRYFPKEGEAKEVAGHKYEGSDRYCPHCNAPQSNVGKNCTYCGAPMDGSAEVRGVAGPVAAPAPKRRWWIGVLIAVAAIIGIVMLVQWCNRTESRAATVTAHRWELSIGIDRFDAHDRAGWEDSIPRSATPTGCRMKQRSTKQVPDGEDCRVEKVDKKDGTFEQVKKCTTRYRSEPVEDRWCSYTVREWSEVDRVTAAGTGLTAVWPAKGLPPATAVESLGATRRGAQRAVYTLELGGLDQAQRCDVSEAVWRKHADGAKVTVEIRARNGDVLCDKL